ncbi:MAG: hypothetical protein A2Y10_13175 [Planctomycetes bacterium GWF2_41_51]|nr:MAG: hypothetical protein A2Y10_13175 [Planctomycetes bacterium GWF2_41_51]HBG60692.1 hypothetical protein [Candidatus Omnitrophota bacterium]
MKIISSLMKVIDCLKEPGITEEYGLKSSSYLPVVNTANAARDTIIVTDESFSMENDDFKPTRLDGAIEAGIQYVNSRDNPDDRVAVVGFSTEANIVLPLTSIKNKGKIVEAMRCLRIDGGTDINEGLKAAVDIFNRETINSQRYVILLTDGHGGQPLETSAILKNQYYAVIEVVGIGGTPMVVNEPLLHDIATTDADGFTHYRFIKDSVSLKKHYKNLATALEWKGI